MKGICAQEKMGWASDWFATGSSPTGAMYGDRQRVRRSQNRILSQPQSVAWLVSVTSSHSCNLTWLPTPARTGKRPTLTAYLCELSLATIDGRNQVKIGFYSIIATMVAGTWGSLLS